MSDRKDQNIILVGPMGVGKTTIGRLLAAQLKMPFLDSDREIESSTGANIPWIFDVEGEAGFRQREEKMIEELTQRRGIILATGGGAVLSESSRQRMRENGSVVYLSASVAQQMERTSKDRNRPLLQTGDRLAKIRELVKVREPLYRSVAHVSVDTTRRSPRSVSQEIIRLLSRKQNNAGPDSGRARKQKQAHKNHS